MSPENPEPVELRIETTDGRVRFAMPKFLVYGVARVNWIEGPGEALRALEARSLDELEGRRLPRAAAPVPAQAGLRTAQVPEPRLHRPGARDRPA